MISVLIELDQFSKQEEAGRVGDARGLLHVVRHDDDGALFPDRQKQEVLDFGGSDRIERGAGLVEKENFRINRRARGRCKAVAAGRPKARMRTFCNLSFTSSHKAARRRLFSTIVAQISFEAIHAGAVSDVFEDRFREKDWGAGKPCRHGGARLVTSSSRMSWLTLEKNLAFPACGL